MTTYAKKSPVLPVSLFGPGAPAKLSDRRRLPGTALWTGVAAPHMTRSGDNDGAKRLLSARFA